MKRVNNMDAVSPVIGVILMVAITVILAAVIVGEVSYPWQWSASPIPCFLTTLGAFVFGMSGNITRTHVVAWSSHKISANEISVTQLGGQDASSLQSVRIVTEPAGTQATSPNGLTVGDTISITANTTDAYNARTQVRVIGTFSDGGSEQVLYETTL